MPKNPPLRVVLGLAAAVPLLCFVHSVLGNSVEPYVWSEEVARGVPQAGLVHRHRTEGWADSALADYGFTGNVELPASGRVVLVWGDSHVEGRALRDEEKISSQLNRLWSENGAEGAGSLTAIDLGLSGSNVVAVHRLLPRYEKLIGNVAYHVVVVARPSYLQPDLSRGGDVLVTGASPHIQHALVERPVASEQRLLRLANRLRLDWGYTLFRDASRVRLRFAPGTATRPEAPDDLISTDEEEVAAAWRLLLAELQQMASAPILFVYCPAVPRVERTGISFLDPNDAQWALFSEQCSEASVTCLNLASDFRQLFEEENRFPRGFANNHLYRGHLNSSGARVIAQRLVHFFGRPSQLAAIDAVHSD